MCVFITYLETITTMCSIIVGNEMNCLTLKYSVCILFIGLIVVMWFQVVYMYFLQFHQTFSSHNIFAICLGDRL